MGAAQRNDLKGWYIMKESVQTAYDILQHGSEKAAAVMSAIKELGNTDLDIDCKLIEDPAELTKPENWDKFAMIREMLRLHNTVSGLCNALSDELANIQEAVNILDKALACSANS